MVKRYVNFQFYFVDSLDGRGNEVAELIVLSILFCRFVLVELAKQGVDSNFQFYFVDSSSIVGYLCLAFMSSITFNSIL
jgi:hypothetical protein